MKYVKQNVRTEGTGNGHYIKARQIAPPPPIWMLITKKRRGRILKLNTVRERGIPKCVSRELLFSLF